MNFVGKLSGSPSNLEVFDVCFLFSDTAVVRQEDESPNDRNDRGIVEFRLMAIHSHSCLYVGIRTAAQWYRDHLSLANPVIRGQSAVIPSVVLLTDDVDNRRKASIGQVKTASGTVFPPSIILFL